ncbi:MAG: amidohydrolase [Planctomycetes bacterium]|nr:amidohydrolase [Planctomycetota bacterium]
MPTESNDQSTSLMIHNATIWTGDPDNPWATTMVVRGGRFVYVGSEEERGRGPSAALRGSDNVPLREPAPQIIDAHGALVIPGLVDAHAHMLAGGFMLDQVQLKDATDKADFIQRIAAHSATMPETGEWIQGGWWSTAQWTDTGTASDRQPTRHWIDAVTSDRPVCLMQTDGHSALCNSIALTIAGITANGPASPPGGVIERDKTIGEPTGILRDTAMNLVKKHIPPYTVDQQVAALRRAAGHAVSHGVTTIAGDIPLLSELPAYQALADDPGDLPVRLMVYPITPDWSEALEPLRAFRPSADRIEIKGLKSFLDGALGSRTGAMLEPYLDPATGGRPDPEGWRGVLTPEADQETLTTNLAIALQHGLQPMVHAIGDEANRVLLDAYARVYGERGGVADARCRMEHCQHLHPDDIARAGRLGVIASMQPYHKYGDASTIDRLIGAERAAASFAFGPLAAAGARLAFGTDWPVVGIDPFRTIDVAVTGRVAGGAPWHPENSVSAPHALRASTYGAAWAGRIEQRIGTIREGMLADFVILETESRPPKPGNSQQLHKWLQEIEWLQVQPRSVHSGGRPVYQDSGL